MCQRNMARAEYVTRFAREARIHDTDVGKAAPAVTAVARRHMSAGVVDEAFGLLPADLRELLESKAPGGGVAAAAKPRIPPAHAWSRAHPGQLTASGRASAGPLVSGAVR